PPPTPPSTLSLHDALPICSTDNCYESMRTVALLLLLAAGAPALSAQTPAGPSSTYPTYPTGPTGREAMKAAARSRAQSGDFEGRSEEHTSELQSLAYLVCR